jgi:hypothetical protein
MNLKFHVYRSAVRFLYAYFFNDKQQQSNSIRRFCKEYNIELHDKPNSSVNQLEETTNNNTLNLDEPENDDVDLVVVSKQQNYESANDEAHISPSHLEPVNRPTTRKRKVDQLIDSPNIDEENTPPPRKTTRSTYRKRR